MNVARLTRVEQVEQLLQRGSQNRTTAATVWNHESSRSHTILSLELETIIHQSGPSSPDDKPSTQDDPAVTTSGSGSLGSADGAPDSGRGWRPTVPTETIRRRSILNIVDLAGSATCVVPRLYARHDALEW